MSDDSEPAPELAPLDWADAQAVQSTADIAKSENVKPIEASVFLLAGALREIDKLKSQLQSTHQLLGVKSAPTPNDRSPDFSD